jgi:hypothetical protein
VPGPSVTRDGADRPRYAGTNRHCHAAVFSAPAVSKSRTSTDTIDFGYRVNLHLQGVRASANFFDRTRFDIEMTDRRVEQVRATRAKWTNQRWARRQIDDGLALALCHFHHGLSQAAKAVEALSEIEFLPATLGPYQTHQSLLIGGRPAIEVF